MKLTHNRELEAWLVHRQKDEQRLRELQETAEIQVCVRCRCISCACFLAFDDDDKGSGGETGAPN